MRNRSSIVAMLTACLLSASPMSAQQSVLKPADLRAAMVEKAATDAARRDLVVSVLRDEEVQQIARDLSLDLTRAEQAVSTLSDKDLEAAAAAAGALQKDLTGEADSVTISITTLLLLVIIVILLAN